MSKSQQISHLSRAQVVIKLQVVFPYDSDSKLERVKSVKKIGSITGCENGP